MSEYQTIEGELMAMEISLQDAVLERVHYDLYNEVEWDLEYVIDDDIGRIKDLLQQLLYGMVGLE